MRTTIYGIFSVTTTLYGICCLTIKDQFISFMKANSICGFTVLGIAWILMMVTAILFHDHIMKNEAIRGKWFHVVRIILLMTNPISFPLYWLFFFVINKAKPVETGFPSARE